MSIGTAGLLGVGLAGAAAGGIAGAIGSNQSQSYGVQTGPMSTLGNFGSAASQDAFQNYINQVNQANPYTNGANASLAQMLQQYAQTGGLPNQGQVGMANLYAQNIFAPQQAALNNSYGMAKMDTARTAANLGRSVDDPILNAKLAQYQGQQQAVLSGQQGSLAAQTAMSLPQQQLQYQQMLAQQAQQNQTGILGLGQGLLQNAQNYQLATATRNQSAQSGGGLGGALGGVFGGLAGGLSLGNTLSNYYPSTQTSGGSNYIPGFGDTGVGNVGFGYNGSLGGGGYNGYSLGGYQPAGQFGLNGYQGGQQYTLGLGR